MHAPSVYTSRRAPGGVGGRSPGAGSSGSTPCATCASASNMGSTGRRPVRACPAVSRPLRARRSSAGTAARRTSSHRGHCQKRCSGSSSAWAQCGQIVRPPFHRLAVVSHTTPPAITARSAPAASAGKQ
eukprot:7675081-Lingulodinium_polyedra.AAC.1